MGLVEIFGLFELREDVADGRRREAQPAPSREVLRRDRIARLDVLADERGQQAARPF
jgi:hypothetical protein